MDDERRRWQRMPRNGSSAGGSSRRGRVAVSSDPAPMLTLPSVPVMPAIPSQALDPATSYPSSYPAAEQSDPAASQHGTARRPRAPRAPRAANTANTPTSSHIPPTSSGKHRTLLSGAHPRINTPADAWKHDASLSNPANDVENATWDTDTPRSRCKRIPARPLTLAAMASATAPDAIDDEYENAALAAYDGYRTYDFDEHGGDEDEDGNASEDGYGGYAPARRELTPSTALAPLPTESVPNLIAFRPPIEAMQRSRIRSQTRALVKSARSPWSIARAALALTALVIAIFSAVGHMGEPAQPLLANFQTSGGVTAGSAIVNLVQAETQGKRPDLYDNYQQFSDWWDAACSAAVTSEVLTAYGTPNATIGHMIDEMVPDISLYGGLLSYHGFTRAAQKNGFRADFYTSLTDSQMLYITNQLGLPLIVNVHISYGYYQFFSGGHFLVITGGDSQGLRIVDSSEYYIHYLPWSVFDSMFTHHEVLIVPKSYTYNLPPS